MGKSLPAAAGTTNQRKLLKQSLDVAESLSLKCQKLKQPLTGKTLPNNKVKARTRISAGTDTEIAIAFHVELTVEWSTSARPRQLIKLSRCKRRLRRRTSAIVPSLSLSIPKAFDMNTQVKMQSDGLITLLLIFSVDRRPRRISWASVRHFTDGLSSVLQNNFALLFKLHYHQDFFLILAG